MGFLGLKLLKYIENEHIELEVLVTLSCTSFCQLFLIISASQLF